MTMANRFGKFLKVCLNVVAKLFGFKWHELVDARVRVILFLGLKGKKKKVFDVGLNKSGTSSLGQSMRDLGRH